MAKKQVSRKELLKKTDEFINFSTRLALFIEKHKIRMLYSALAIVVVFSIGSGIRYFSGRAETRAFALLDNAIFKYNTDYQENSEDAAYLNVKQDFEHILDQYSGKKAADIAGVLYADICYNAQDFDRAIKLYKNAVDNFDGNGFYRNMALSGLGYACEEKKDYKAALSYFQQLKDSGDNFMKYDALVKLGEIYSITGKTYKRDKIFDKIISDYPDSSYAKVVGERLNQGIRKK
jgi:tetratricopeptide (TPR) repeat protein